MVAQIGPEENKARVSINDRSATEFSARWFGQKDIQSIVIGSVQDVSMWRNVGTGRILKEVDIEWYFGPFGCHPSQR